MADYQIDDDQREEFEEAYVEVAKSTANPLTTAQLMQTLRNLGQMYVCFRGDVFSSLESGREWELWGGVAKKKGVGGAPASFCDCFGALSALLRVG